MLASNNAVKKTALASIRENLTVCIVAGVIFLFICFVGALMQEILGMVFSGVFAALFIIVFSVAVAFPLFLGLLRFIRRVVWGKIDSVASIFYYFSSKPRYKSAFVLSANLAVRALIGFLVLSIPQMVLNLLSSPKFYEMLDLSVPIWTSYIWPLLIFFKVASAVLFVIFMLKFYIAPFFFVATDYSAEECIVLSNRLSVRTAADYVWLIIGLFGWVVLSALIVPLVFTLPYFIACYIVHCRFAVAQYNKVVDQMENAPPSFEADTSI